MVPSTRVIVWSQELWNWGWYLGNGLYICWTVITGTIPSWGLRFRSTQQDIPSIRNSNRRDLAGMSYPWENLKWFCINKSIVVCGVLCQVTCTSYAHQFNQGFPQNRRRVITYRQVFGRKSGDHCNQPCDNMSAIALFRVHSVLVWLAWAFDECTFFKVVYLADCKSI